MKIVEPTICSYAAGIIDGEGCICVGKNKNRKRYHLHVSVVMYYNDVPQYLRLHFGGHLIPIKRKRGGNYWRWAVYDRWALLFLQQLKPYLTQKSRLADIGIEFGPRLNHAGGSDKGRHGRNPLTEGELEAREILYQRCKELNQYAHS